MARNFNNLFADMFNDDFAQIVKKSWGEYTKTEKKIIEEWNNKIGKENALDFTVFRDANFFHSFLKVIPKEEQFNYAENTYKYFKNQDCNHEYVIVTRRAVPSENPKREGFWTDEHRTALVGLKREIPAKSPERLHSVIMVSTLKKLEQHGIDKSSGPRSDGEIRIDSSKTFNDFLFMYKPEDEKEDLKEYLKNGGMTREEVLEKHKKEADIRRKEYMKSYGANLRNLEYGESVSTKLGKQVIEDMINVAYQSETEKDINVQLNLEKDKETKEQ